MSVKQMESFPRKIVADLPEIQVSQKNVADHIIHSIGRVWQKEIQK